MTHTIHWLGAGLSSIPGILKLDDGPNPLIIWNRSLKKAQDTLAELKTGMDIRQLDWQELEKTIAPGDVLVSMLPATQHLKVAQLCLKTKANFVSSSYIAPEMAKLDAQAKSLGLCFVNEVGLDPGLDHLFAHSLMNEYKGSAQFSPSNEHDFRSYCGGFPKTPNDFKYKFSWSPLGVLRALKSPSRCITQGQERASQAPWQALTTYNVQSPEGSEEFQAYANRDSVPFLKQYGFGEDWNVREFVRGTLRLAGWSTAWKPIFDELDQLTGDAAEQRMVEISTELEQKHSYDAGEPDRVVLCVELDVHRDGKSIWHKSYQMDSQGNASGQAMARLVSWTVAIAIDSLLAGDIPQGVSAAPEQPELIAKWLGKLEELGEKITVSDSTPAAEI